MSSKKRETFSTTNSGTRGRDTGYGKHDTQGVVTFV